MATIYTVTQVNQYIKNMFNTDYLLKDVQVHGEISNLKYHSSGHIYFTLKEEGSAIAGVMFKSARYSGLDFELENGQSVIVRGNISVYERDGRYQIYANEIFMNGIGNLYEAYEILKQKLYEEGLFEFEHKKDIPKYPKKIGIVTAKTGAAIQDICNIAKRRNPFVQLYLYPAKVQGDGAAKTIVAGIKTLDKMGLDTIIIGRGGGSIEDLWAFNEEIVARAIYDAVTPIISGTGHEIDNTIADYVADLRAPTPSAACELAIPDVISYLNQLKQYGETMTKHMSYRVMHMKQRYAMFQTRLDAVSPVNTLENQKIYHDMLSDRMIQAMEKKYDKEKHHFEMLLAKLNGLSPTAKLIGGYGYIADDADNPVRSVDNLKNDDCFSVTLWDGTIEGCVRAVHKDLEK
ncbi:MAG: exodeoxyribonuclease VII large subunit [Eubacteriales bacterium]|nr:exodeoxyribonuclease VII large subunit [Eubacteriales bacterium]